MADTLQTGHTYKFKVNNTVLVITDKSYAGCFRKFWDYFMNYDLERTVKTIENASIRTSDSELFIAKNGSKKKNIPLKDGFWIYTHLTPKLMESAYAKFIFEWNQEPKEKVLQSNGYDERKSWVDEYL